MVLNKVFFDNFGVILSFSDSVGKFFSNHFKKYSLFSPKSIEYESNLSFGFFIGTLDTVRHE